MIRRTVPMILVMNRHCFLPLLLYLCISILVLACQSTRKEIKEGKCSVSVHIDNVPDTTYAKVAWLHQNDDIFDIEEIDSIPVINGRFSFECTIERLTSASICIDRNYMRIYLEPGEIEVNLDGATPYLVSLSGTSVDKELEEVNRYLLTNSKRSYNDCFNQFGGYCYHTERYDLVEHRKTIKQRQRLLLGFCRSYMDYRIVPDLLHQVLLLYEGEMLSTHEIVNIHHVLQGIFRKIPSENRNSEFYEMLEWEMKQIQLTAKANGHIGEKAPDIQFKTAYGSLFQLQSYLRDDFVLLHFGGNNIAVDEFRKLADYYNIPKLKLISITENCMPEDETAFVQFVGGRWPISLYVHGYSYYGIRPVSPAFIYQVGALPLCVLISPNGTVIGRWNGENMPNGEEIERVMNSCSSSCDHFSK